MLVEVSEEVNAYRLWKLFDAAAPAPSTRRLWRQQQRANAVAFWAAMGRGNEPSADRAARLKGQER